MEVQITPARLYREVLRKAGKLIPLPVKVVAMIDTGAAISAITPDVITTLGINPIGKIKISTPTSTGVDCYQYHVAIVMPNQNTIETTEIVETPLEGQHIQCLIGRDILRHSVFIYNGSEGIITICF
ncbi:MAG: retroviral-like aspartic protease [Nitrospirae bacterium]|uniref:retropepsin-like aspartic protease n=1 Tax=Candidatus Magnetobacterium casense TaxID=1455061 RepID=UPI0012DFB10E|nr:retropepsin-like aspartic protease [Candidatus Magnetobacterium casensis]MBF0337184.1 retroviral-like aspartic protease [Nitrospirota bacterium]